MEGLLVCGLNIVGCDSSMDSSKSTVGWCDGAGFVSGFEVLGSDLVASVEGAAVEAEVVRLRGLSAKVKDN